MMKLDLKIMNVGVMVYYNIYQCDDVLTKGKVRYKLVSEDGKIENFIIQDCINYSLEDTLKYNGYIIIR